MFIFKIFFSLFLNQGHAEALVQGENLLVPKASIVAVNAADKKGLAVIFMSAKCPCSDSHIPVVKKLVERYKDFNFVIVHSNLDESVETSRAYFLKANLQAPVIQDHHTIIANEFKANKTPHAFLLSPSGEILYQGGVTDSAKAPSAEKHPLEDAIKDILENKKVRVSKARTLGCGISREGEKNVL